MDIWDEYLLEQENDSKLRHFLDMQGLILFFKKGDEYFGAGEDSRVVFARLKNPDSDVSKGWGEEASFTATNLNKMVRGEPSTHVFSKDDIKKIKVVDRDDVVRELSSKAAEAGARLGAVKIIKIGRFDIGQGDRDDAPNFVRADEE